MSVCERLFSSKNRTNLKNSLQISAKCHLFVKLRTLSKTSRLTKVLKFEDIGTTFWGSSNQLGWVNLNKVFAQKELSVKLADSGLKSKNRLVSWHSQINNAVVQSCVLINNRHLFFAFFSLGLSAIFCLLVKHLSAGIFKLERKHWHRFVHSPDFKNLELHLYGASSDWIVWFHNFRNKFDDWFTWNLASVRTHTLADCFSNKHDSLSSCIWFTHN